jgi:hypothetical protein
LENVETCLLNFLYSRHCFALLPVSFLLEEGLNINAFFSELFANQISGFLGMDVIVSSLVFGTFVFSEGSRLKMKNLWIYIASNLLVGVSLGLPLFLLMRQRKLEETA